jgi:hypothetical protein
VAEFYAAGGRQGNAGQKLNNGGLIYEFKVSGKALYVYGEEATMADVQSDMEEAEEAFTRRVCSIGNRRAKSGIPGSGAVEGRKAARDSKGDELRQLARASGFPRSSRTEAVLVQTIAYCVRV